MELIKKIEHFKTLTELNEYFNQNSALEFWENIRFKNGYFCPRCGSLHVYKCKNHSYSCADCKNHFTATANTIFSSTKIDLKYWFVALWCVLNNPNGVSSYQMARNNGLSQKTNFYLEMKLRYLIEIHQVRTFGRFSLCECGTHVVYNESVGRYICPKCGKQYVSVKGHLIEEYKFTNIHYAAVYNSYKMKQDAKEENKRPLSQSFFPKVLDRCKVNDLNREEFNYIFKRISEELPKANEIKEEIKVSVDEFYIYSDCKKQKGIRRLLDYRNSRKLCAMVLVDENNNTMMIPFDESKCNNGKQYVDFLSKYIGNESTLCSDEGKNFKLFANIINNHISSSHKKKIFVVEENGKKYTSNICETNVRYFKRCVRGCYNAISSKYFHLYLATRSFRAKFNTDRNTNLERIEQFFLNIDLSKTITINQLISLKY